jgi:hypothetical protein
MHHRLDHLWTGAGPDDPHGITGAIRSLLRRPAVIGSLAVLAFAVLHSAITVGASYWRYWGAQQAYAPTQAALAAWRVAAAGLTGRDAEWAGLWSPIGPPTLDLDGWAALEQVAAATTAFAALLGVALVLAVHGRRRLAVVAALTTGASVAAMAGVLARVSPMVPVAGDTDPRYLNLDEYPEALRGPRVLLAAAMAAQDTSTWWNWSIAFLTAALALGAVVVVLRRSPPTPIPAGRPQPATSGAVVLGAAALVTLLGGSAVLALAQSLGAEDVDLAVSVPFLVITALTIFSAAAAASTSRAFVAILLSLGFLVVHSLLHAAFDRGGGAPGGWGVGTGGLQVYATWGSAAALIAAPVLGWAVASTSAVLRSRARRRHVTPVLV